MGRLKSPATPGLLHKHPLLQTAQKRGQKLRNKKEKRKKKRKKGDPSQPSAGSRLGWACRGSPGSRHRHPSCSDRRQHRLREPRSPHFTTETNSNSEEKSTRAKGTSLGDCPSLNCLAHTAQVNHHCSSIRKGTRRQSPLLSSCATAPRHTGR